jgi:hypothetical protein
LDVCVWGSVFAGLLRKDARLRLRGSCAKLGAGVVSLGFVAYLSDEIACLMVYLFDSLFAYPISL